MNIKNIVSAIALFAATTSTLKAQGTPTFIYDQQSAAAPDIATDGGEIPSVEFGQSFTPRLNTVGFVSFELISALARPNGAVVAVNLRADSIIGTILGTTDPISMPPGTSGNPDFVFSLPVPVTPGTTYYLEPFVLSGDNYFIGASDSYNYAGGSAIYNGIPSPTSDLWFREGITEAPEPNTWPLILSAAAAAYCARRKRW